MPDFPAPQPNLFGYDAVEHRCLALEQLAGIGYVGFQFRYASDDYLQLACLQPPRQAPPGLLWPEFSFDLADSESGLHRLPILYDPAPDLNVPPRAGVAVVLPPRCSLFPLCLQLLLSGCKVSSCIAGCVVFLFGLLNLACIIEHVLKPDHNTSPLCALFVRRRVGWVVVGVVKWF